MSTNIMVSFEDNRDQKSSEIPKRGKLFVIIIQYSKIRLQ